MSLGGMLAPTPEALPGPIRTSGWHSISGSRAAGRPVLMFTKKGPRGTSDKISDLSNEVQEGVR